MYNSKTIIELPLTVQQLPQVNLFRITLHKSTNFTFQEMLMKIFSMLSLNDLSNVILVCKKWKKVAESPWLWRRMEIVVGQMKVFWKV